MSQPHAVLLVEQDPDVVAEFRHALESRGFQVWAAADGIAGLDLARTHRPVVIVGDFPIAMPGNGSFTAAVREDRELADTVIITVTDRLLTEKDSAAWAHSERVLAKPIDGARLAEEISWVVERRRARSA